MAKSRNQDTETTTRATDNVERAGTPKQGDVYRCDVCGMELEITTGLPLRRQERSPLSMLWAGVGGSVGEA